MYVNFLSTNLLYKPALRGLSATAELLVGDNWRAYSPILYNFLALHNAFIFG